MDTDDYAVHPDLLNMVSTSADDSKLFVVPIEDGGSTYYSINPDFIIPNSNPAKLNSDGVKVLNDAQAYLQTQLAKHDQAKLTEFFSSYRNTNYDGAGDIRRFGSDTGNVDGKAVADKFTVKHL